MFYSKERWFTKRYEGNFNWVYGYIFIRVGDHAQTEDLVSEIWETVYGSMDSLRSRSRKVFSAWLFKIVRSNLAKYFLKTKKMETLDLMNFEIIANENVSEDVENNITYGHFRKLTNSLPSSQKETLFLRYVSEFSNKEIAESLGVSEKTVSSNLSRAISFLKKHHSLTISQYE